jgi:hypothetical protein
MYRHNLALVILLGVASASWAGAESFFEERVHDFGATPRGPTLVHYFRFTNNSKETLTVGNVRVSCGCVTASAPVTQVKPGDSSYIMAQMDSRRFTGAKSVTVYVLFTSPRYEEISLQVQANGRDDFTMYPDTVSFGQVTRGNTPKASVQVTLLGDPNWQVTEVKPDSDYVKPTAKLVKRNGAEVTYEISATLRPDLPVGKWYTDIWLKTSNSSLSKVRVPLTVDVNAALSATPSILQFGDVKVGDSIEQNVLVRGEKAFRIKSVKGSDPLIKVSEINSESKVVHLLRVSFKPSTTGEVTRSVSIVTDDGDEPAVTIPIRGKGISD